MIYRLQNPIQNYPWGSTTALTELFGIDNASREPQAEIWMGAHPNGCSSVKVHDRDTLLSDLITQAPEKVLGATVNKTFGGLPYLLKILAAAEPLSIQVHPEKSKAEAGFERENHRGIPLTANHRNYKDPNHKPELIYALTPYLAMNAFRPIDETIELFEVADCSSLMAAMSELKGHTDADHLQKFFCFILKLDGKQKKEALQQLLNGLESKGHNDLHRTAFATVSLLAEYYPDDIGLFSPLFLNVIELKPGEAMFLNAETPHAYLRGTGIEIMANSDNVLRAGLTPKHMDVEELIANTRFKSIPASELLTKPEQNGMVTQFPVPVSDFIFEIVTLGKDSDLHKQHVDGPEILLCIAGSISVTRGKTILTLTVSESCFVEACTDDYQLSGCGQVVRISV